MGLSPVHPQLCEQVPVTCRIEQTYFDSPDYICCAALARLVSVCLGFLLCKIGILLASLSQFLGKSFYLKYLSV